MDSDRRNFTGRTEEAVKLLRLQENGEPAILGDLLSRPQAEQIQTFWASPNIPGQPQALEASLMNGFPVRIALRAILPDSGHMLLCLEERLHRRACGCEVASSTGGT